MDNYIVASNIFVILSLFLITCPKESSEYPMLAVQSDLRFSPRLETRQEIDEDRFMDPNFPNQTATIEPPYEPNQGIPVMISVEKEWNVEDSSAQNRNAKLSKRQKDYINEIPHGSLQ